MGRMFQDERQAQGRSWTRTDLGHWRADGSQWGRNIVSAGEWPRGGRRDTQGLAHMGLVSHEHLISLQELESTEGFQQRVRYLYLQF